MFKKTKATALIAMTSIAAPLIATISCSSSGGVGRFNTKNDKQIKIYTTFSANGSQEHAVDALAQAWNNTHENDMQISILNNVGGYDKQSQAISKWLAAKDGNSLPNLFLGYPDTLGTVVKYDMQLPFETTRGTLANKFDSNIIKENDLIGGLPKGGTYVLPVAKSVDMTTINKPLMGYILEQAKTKNLIASSSITKINALIAAAGPGSDAEGATIKANWPFKGSYNYSEAIKYDDSIFTDNSKLLDFITEAIKMFNEKVSTKKSTRFILGIDAPTNFIYSAVYSKLNASDSKFLLSKDKDGYVKYNMKDKNSDSWKAFDEIYTKIKKAVDAGALYLNTGGAYASNLEIKHELAMFVGSTAGYSHSFKDGQTPYAISNDNKHIVLSSHTDKVDLSKADASKGILGEFSTTHHNKIFASTSTEPKGRYDITLKDASADTAWNTLVGKDHTNTKLFITSDPQQANIPNDKKVLLTTENYAKYLVLTDGFVSNEGTVQKTELEISKPPLTFETNTSVILPQGPSFIGIHNNDSEDKAVIKFLEWALDQKTDLNNWSVEYSKATINDTYMEAFAKDASYFMPSKHNLGLVTLPGTPNPAEKIAFETLKDINKGTIKPILSPSDDTTASTRKAISDIVSAQYTSYVNGVSTIDSNGIYNELVKRNVF